MSEQQNLPPLEQPRLGAEPIVLLSFIAALYAEVEQLRGMLQQREQQLSAALNPPPEQKKPKA